MKYSENNVVIKYSKNTLTLRLNSSIPFVALVKEVCVKFAENKKFFGAGDYILTVVGRELSLEEEKALVDSIELNSDVRIRFIKTAEDDIKELKNIEELEKFKKDELLKSAVILKGSIAQDKQKDYETSIVILGDVKPGSVITSKGNIIVFGTIYGFVHAGYPDTDNAFIACTALETDEVAIGGIKSAVKINKKWSFRKTTSNEINYGIIQFDNDLICEPLKTGLLKQL